MIENNLKNIIGVLKRRKILYLKLCYFCLSLLGYPITRLVEFQFHCAIGFIGSRRRAEVAFRNHTCLGKQAFSNARLSLRSGSYYSINEFPLRRQLTVGDNRYYDFYTPYGCHVGRVAATISRDNSCILQMNRTGPLSSWDRCTARGDQRS